MCNDPYPLWKCPDFIKHSVKERLRIVSEAHLCFNCLKSKDHVARRCPTLGRCKVDNCGRAHHSLLHFSAEVHPPSLPESSQGDTTGKTVTSLASTLQSKYRARLKKVPVEVTSPQSGLKIKTYAFLNDGSNATLCTTRLMRRLGICGEKESLEISTIFGRRSQRIVKLDLTVSGVKEPKQFLMKGVYALPRLPDVSENIVKREDISELPHLEGIEIPIVGNQDVDILIGMDNVECLLVDGTRVGRADQPLGLHTGLGWKLAGSRPSGNEGSAAIHFTSLGYNLIHDQLNYMFSYDFCEAASDTDLSPSVEDIQALNQMDSFVRKVDGHYELPLPWRTGCPSLPNNRQVAEKRLNCLRKRFNEEPDLFQQYKDRMNGYEDQGYIRKVPEDAYSDKVWYIPHHATTQSKFRIVFD